MWDGGRFAVQGCDLDETQRHWAGDPLSSGTGLPEVIRGAFSPNWRASPLRRHAEQPQPHSGAAAKPARSACAAAAHGQRLLFGDDPLGPSSGGGLGDAGGASPLVLPASSAACAGGPREDRTYVLLAPESRGGSGNLGHEVKTAHSLFLTRRAAGIRADAQRNVTLLLLGADRDFQDRRARRYDAPPRRRGGRQRRHASCRRG